MTRKLICLLFWFGPVAAVAQTPVVTAPPAVVDAMPSLTPSSPSLAQPDPLASPAESISRVSELWRSGAMSAAIIVAAFFVLLVLRSRLPWLQEHSRAVWISAAVAGLAVAVDGIQRGETPNLSMLVVAAATTLAQLQRMPSGDSGAKS